MVDYGDAADHSILWPDAAAVADVYGPGKVGVVHFDAHPDCHDDMFGHLVTHTTPIRRVIEDEHAARLRRATGFRADLIHAARPTHCVWPTAPASRRPPGASGPGSWRLPSERVRRLVGPCRVMFRVPGSWEALGGYGRTVKLHARTANTHSLGRKWQK